MRHIAKFAIALGTLTCLIPAQNNRDLFWPQEGATPAAFPWPAVSAATRVGGSTTAVVEVYSDRSALLARGLGSSSNTLCELSGMMYVVQDQDQTTGNTFALCARDATPADGPAVLSAYIFKTANLSTPVGTATGGIAWGFTSTFALPLPKLPCENGYYLGVELQAPPVATPADTTFAWTASAFATTAGDNPRLPCPKFHAARVDGSPFVFNRSTSQRTLAINGLFAHATLNVGNVDGGAGNYVSYGVGGAYPDCVGVNLPTDGLNLRVQDDSNVGGLGALYLSTAYFPTGLNLGGIDGAVWISPAGLTPLGNFVLPAAIPGTTVTSIVPPGIIPATTGVQLTFQAITVSATFTNGRLTNAVSTNL